MSQTLGTAARAVPPRAHFASTFRSRVAQSVIGCDAHNNLRNLCAASYASSLDDVASVLRCCATRPIAIRSRSGVARSGWLTFRASAYELRDKGGLQDASLRLSVLPTSAMSGLGQLQKLRHHPLTKSHIEDAKPGTARATRDNTAVNRRPSALGKGASVHGGEAYVKGTSNGDILAAGAVEGGMRKTVSFSEFADVGGGLEVVRFQSKPGKGSGGAGAGSSSVATPDPSAATSAAGKWLLGVVERRKEKG